MEKFLEKFNIFDLFTMLIPGIIVLLLICISLSFQFYSFWFAIGGEKYIIFFLFSYLIGITLQEFGSIMDKYLLGKLTYGGSIRELFLLENHYKKFFDNNLSFQIAQYVKQNILKSINLNNIKGVTERECNSFIYSYCVSFLEINNLSAKADKMSALSEMSRSLFYGFLLVIIINFPVSLQNPSLCTFLSFENLILLFLSIIFIYRKIRYEKYRLRILFRTFYIYNQ